jgi:hypothetical protein
MGHRTTSVNTAHADLEVYEILKRSIQAADKVQLASKGEHREPAFGRLPQKVVFVAAGDDANEMKRELLPRLRLLEKITSIQLIEPTPSTKEVNLVLFGSKHFARRITDEGSQALVRNGMSAAMAERIVPFVRQAGSKECHVNLNYDPRGFIDGFLLVDTSSEIPGPIRFRCTTMALLMIFGLDRDVQQGTAQINQLVALKKIYGVPTNAPFRDLLLSRVENQ